MENKNLVRTFTGKYVNLLNPRPETIHPDDLAHGLSVMPMYLGYPVHLSVAKHTLDMVSSIEQKDPKAKGKVKLHALLSHASEAYIPNVPHCVKKQDKEYYGIEQGIMDVVYKKFGVEESDYLEIVDAADKRVSDVEEQMWVHGKADNAYKIEYIRKAWRDKFSDIIRQIEMEEKEEKK